jgi:hypothetical protein
MRSKSASQTSTPVGAPLKASHEYSPIVAPAPVRLTSVAWVTLAARAWGDFRWSRHFKRERHTTFGRLDEVLCTPLCVLLSTGFALAG